MPCGAIVAVGSRSVERLRVSMKRILVIDPGPLYGIKKDLWSALGIAVTQADVKAGEK